MQLALPSDSKTASVSRLIDIGSFFDELYTTFTEQFVTALCALGA